MTTLSHTDMLAAVRDKLLSDRAFMAQAYAMLEPTGLFEHAVIIKSARGLPGTIHAIEATIFDNWPSGKHTKGAPLSRYAVTIKAWNNDDFRGRFRRPDAQLSCDLRDGAELLKSIKRPKAAPLDAEYASFMTDLAGVIDEAGFLVGMLTSVFKGDGKQVHNHQYVMADTGRIQTAPWNSAAAGALTVVTQAGKFSLPMFVSDDAQGKPLINRAILQSRCAVSNGANWETGVLDFKPNA